jgi:hypothetical protein
LFSPGVAQGAFCACAGDPAIDAAMSNAAKRFMVCLPAVREDYTANAGGNRPPVFIQWV